VPPLSDIESQIMTGFLSLPAPRRRDLLALVLAASLGAAAAPGHAAEGKPVQGGRLIFSDVQLIYSWQRQGAGRYNHGNVIGQIVDRLVYQRPDGAIVPWIASSFESNGDATQFTFKIRPGVSFSDGSPLDANAIKANFDQFGFGDEAKGIPASLEFLGYDRTEIVAPDTVRVILKDPNRYFLIGLSSPTVGIASLRTLEKTFKEQSKPENLIGSGPFVFKSEIPKKEVVLSRRDDYAWPPEGAANPGKPYLQEVVYREIVEEGLRTGALQSGQVHIAKGIQPSDEALLADEGFRIYGQKPLLNVTDQISIRVKNPLVEDRRVRLALSIGIDRKELVETVLSKSYGPTTGLLVRGSPEYVSFDKELAFDPKKANQLLDEAGWVRNAQGIREKDGKQLRLSVAASSQSSAVRPAMEFIGQQWRQLGVVLINRAGDDTFMNQSATNSDVPLRIFRPSLAGGLAGIFGYLRGFNGNNVTTLHADPETEELFRQDLRIVDPAKQRESIAKIQHKLIVENAYTIPVYEASQTYGAAPNVHLTFNSNTVPLFQEAWIGPKK